MYCDLKLDMHGLRNQKKIDSQLKLVFEHAIRKFIGLLVQYLSFKYNYVDNIRLRNHIIIIHFVDILGELIL